MNLQELQKGLANLYPPLRTRSGKLITTHAASGEVTGTGLAIVVKTLFPPSSRQRREFVVSEVDGEVNVRPVDATGMADAEHLAHLLRERWVKEQPGQALPPLRLARDAEGRYGFRVARSREEKTDPATPMAKRAAEASALPPEPPARTEGEPAKRTKKGDN